MTSPGSETPQTDAPARRPGEAAAFVVTIVLLVAIALLGVTLWKTIGKDFKKAAPETAAAGATATAQDPVLVTVNGEEIRQAEFDAAVERLPREMQGVINSPEGRTALAEELIRMKTLEQYARQNELDRQSDVAAALSVSEGEILANAAIRDLVAKQKDVTPRELYDRNRAQFEAVKLSQIVIPFQGSAVAGQNKNVPTEQEAHRIASEIAGRLRGGADFAALAKQVSVDRQTAERGGDLGFVGHGTFPEDVDKMIFSLPVGSVTDPVRTGYGMHVFKVTDKQTRSFEEVEQALARSGKQLQARNVADELRKTAKVEFNPKFFPEEAKKAAAERPPASQAKQ
ncbi:MAG TPA: peptidylprolyl isomerase, partial [Thermoanaerobaculia bacterium]